MSPFWKVSEQHELWSGCEVGKSEDMKGGLGASGGPSGEFPLLWQVVHCLKHVNENTGLLGFLGFSIVRYSRD
jgi:hypothetical protein